MHPDLRSYLERRRRMLERVRGLLVDKLRVQREADEIDPDTPLFATGLALDSIDAVDLLIHLEAELGIEVPSDEGGRSALRTVNSIVDLALEKQEAVDGAE